MHELALCGAIADIVRRRAADRRVETVRLRIGQLRQVVPGTLEYCWSMVTDATSLEGATLQIERVPGRLRCEPCSAEHEMGDEYDLRCRDCGGSRVTITAGEEFLVTSIDVVEMAPK